MLNTVYRLVAPRSFEPVRTELGLGGGNVLVRPTHLSICNADMRYYLGNRSPEVLARKLPMALIHEGIGVVVDDPSGSFAPSSRIVMLPNNPHEKDEHIAENYLRSSEFCGSGYDGFMQECVSLPAARVLELPDAIDDEVAAFTEMVSVAAHAVVRFDKIAHGRRSSIGIWGDGNLAYLVGLVLRMTYPEALLTVIGHNPAKLVDFTFADVRLMSSAVGTSLHVDHAFECCGGMGSGAAIEQIIACIEPEGTISLLGVSENPVPIETRMVLEKGLRLFGSSRSGRADFVAAIGLYERHPEMLGYLDALVGEVVHVRSVSDMSHAFEADLRKSMGKTIMRWDV